MSKSSRLRLISNDFGNKRKRQQINYVAICLQSLQSIGRNLFSSDESDAKIGPDEL